MKTRLTMICIIQVGSCFERVNLEKCLEIGFGQYTAMCQAIWSESTKCRLYGPKQIELIRCGRGRL